MPSWRPRRERRRSRSSTSRPTRTSARTSRLRSRSRGAPTRETAPASRPLRSRARRCGRPHLLDRRRGGLRSRAGRSCHRDGTGRAAPRARPPPAAPCASQRDDRNGRGSGDARARDRRDRPLDGERHRHGAGGPGHAQPAHRGDGRPVQRELGARGVDGAGDRRRGLAPAGYYVQRFPGGIDACGTSAASLTASTSCNDTVPADGTYTYRATAVYSTWTAVSAASNAVIVDTDPPPYVLSINRVGASAASNAANVQWTVTFNEAVTGVNATDFLLANSGLTGAPAITTVTPGVAVSSATFTVTASTGTGSGTLGLSLTDNDSIRDATNQPLGDSSGGVNGNFTGQSFTIDRIAPTNALSLTAQSPAGSSLLTAGNVVFYRGTGGGSGGSFKIRNTVADTGGAGPASSATAALGGTSTGWTHSAGTVSTPAGGPFDSTVFTWNEGTASAPTNVRHRRRPRRQLDGGADTDVQKRLDRAGLGIRDAERGRSYRRGQQQLRQQRRLLDHGTQRVRRDAERDHQLRARLEHPDAADGDADQQRLRHLRRTVDDRRKPGPERPRHGVLPLHAHRHRQRRQQREREVDGDRSTPPRPRHRRWRSAA